MQKKPEFGHKKSGFGRKPGFGKRPEGARPDFKSDRPRGDRPAFNNGRPGTGRPGPRSNMNGPRPAQAHPEMALPRSNANPRKVAVEVVCDVMGKEAYAALSLDERLSAVNLNQLDRRLCASIVYRTLENLYRIDYALAAFLSDPEALEPQVRSILRTAACQIMLHDRVPDSAAVNEAVKLTRELHLDGFAGMVNAVLRRLSEGKETIKWPQPEEGAKYISIMHSLPKWLAQQLIDDYGMEMAEKIAAFRTEKHAITVRPTYGREKEFAACLEKKVWEHEDAVIPGAKYIYGAMQIARDSDFLGGVFSIQGEGSMIAAEAVQIKRGMNVLDCCAAPGGKTAYLAERMEGTGRVYAWDLHSHRVELIRGVTHRLKLENVRTAARDATALREEMVETMDAVLLDAPCSGLGVMDDKPDVKYRPTLASVKELCETQKKLLDTCSRYVKRGGTLVYSTCSILKDENERQIKQFLHDHPEFKMDTLPETIPAQLRENCGEYGLQLLPCRDKVEGFFVARMKRI